MNLDQRKDRLERARLYFVCDAGFDPVELEALLGQALGGGADLIQLRDKTAPAAALRAAASLFREAAAEHGALFIVNDDPQLASVCGADGVHVGQDDAAVAAARETIGPDGLVGLSTHHPDQLAAALAAGGASRPDYVSVGPVWETPTKAGRAAAGLDYVRDAARRVPPGTLPWFAIGGIDESNATAVRDAGAERLAVVRAIRDAAEPRAVAASLSATIAPEQPAPEAPVR
jgi:thiamine-phosphate pyrophosphorylase